MKILYGIVGQGMGHAIRSGVILQHLKKHHDIQVVVSGRAFEYTKRIIPNVQNIEGFELSIDGNILDRSKTIGNLIKQLPKKTARNVSKFIETSLKFSPDAIISDFESFSYIFGKLYKIPVISVDNMQIINRCILEIPTSLINDYLLVKTVVKNKLPGCYHYLITTFFYPEIRKERTSLHPPVLRDEILNAETSEGEHILVYQTTATNDEFLEILRDVDTPFIVYGYNISEKLSNVEFKEFSESGFINDLVSCRAVIANGGFSLMGEAIHLKKPFFAIPVVKQFEQVLNGIYLQKLRYGEYHMEMKREPVVNFLDKLDIYRQNLEGYERKNNSEILRKLDSLLDELNK
ncbi:teichoic acid biosynthesis protein [bacterium]|nr:teichoic acid biosynthesis protein [bacterium]